MIQDKLYEPDAEFLRGWSSLVPGPFGPGGAAMDDRPARVRSLMEMLASQGFTPVPSGPFPPKITQSLGEDPHVLAMVHWSHSKDGELDHGGIAWTVAQGMQAEDLEDVVQTLLARISSVFGEPAGVIWQIARWNEEGRHADSPALAAFWTRPLPGKADIMQAATRAHDTLASYRLHLREAKSPLSMVATVSRDNDGTWSVSVLLRN